MFEIGIGTGIGLWLKRLFGSAPTHNRINCYYLSGAPAHYNIRCKEWQLKTHYKNIGRTTKFRFKNLGQSWQTFQNVHN